MGRSVSVPSGVAWVFYLTIAGMGCEDSFDFDMLVVNGIRAALKARFPSLSDADYFVSNEDRAILHNCHGSIGVSEYCGLVSVWGLPDDTDAEYAGLAESWFLQVEDKVSAALSETFPDAMLNPMGTMSNGEQVFRPASRPDGVVTSKEGTLW